MNPGKKKPCSQTLLLSPPCFPQYSPQAQGNQTRYSQAQCSQSTNFSMNMTPAEFFASLNMAPPQPQPVRIAYTQCALGSAQSPQLGTPSVLDRLGQPPHLSRSVQQVQWPTADIIQPSFLNPAGFWRTGQPPPPPAASPPKIDYTLYDNNIASNNNFAATYNNNLI